MSKHSPLGDFLKAWPDREVTLTFEEIEEIIGSRLPPSAYAKRGFWTNSTNEYVRPSGPGWVSVGWHVARAGAGNGAVTIEKVEAD